MTKFTPLYGVHMALGAEMITTSAGYRMPAHYRPLEEEHRAVRERAGMMDISLMGRIDIKGRDAFRFLQRVAANDAEKLSDGQLMYTTLCNEEGGIVDDLTVWRFSADHYRIVTSSIMRYRTMKWLQDQVGDQEDVYLTDISSSLGMIAVQGPKSRELLQDIFDGNMGALKFFHFTSGKLSGGIPALIARVGFSGELGFECYFGAEDTVEAWNKIFEAGKKYGALPYGFDALDSLRFEKGYIFYGYEVTQENNPFECGLERWVAFDKRGGFLGREALLHVKEAGPTKKLVALEVEGDDLLPEKRPVRAEDGVAIGETVYGFKGLSVGKNLAWAWIKTAYAKDGKKVTIDGRSARIAPLRYYDPEGKRMKG